MKKAEQIAQNHMNIPGYIHKTAGLIRVYKHIRIKDWRGYISREQK